MENRMFWYRVLDNAKKNLPLENGVTIPFMIGAYYESDHVCDLSSSSCLKVILDDIIESKIPVTIFKCTYLPGYPYIISVPSEGIDATIMRFNPHVASLIYLDTGFRNKTEQSESEYEVQTVADRLYKLYSQEIQGKHFSFEEGVWRPFKALELEIIKMSATQ